VISALDFDVIVVGGGGGGLAAAATAAEAGATVLVAEAAPRIGGATALSGGSFMAAGTPAQAAAGYPGDTVDEFFDHYLTFNRWQADPAVARRFCEQATPTMAWLTGLGVDFRPENLYRAARWPSSTPCTARAGPAAWSSPSATASTTSSCATGAWPACGRAARSSPRTP
jgi:fumarate reductase flavoprotein subunit